MATALRSSPPPPGEGTEEARAKYLVPLPAMKLRSPRREAGRRRAAKRFDEVMRKRGASNCEMAEVVGCQERLVRDWRRSKEGGQWGDLYAMDRRAALALLDAIRMDLLSDDDDSHR